MRLLLSTLLIAALSTAIAQAETRYVTDQLIVTVRTGPSTKNKILQSLKTGAPVEVLAEEGADYLRVRTNKGIEGYTLKQYYSKEIPKAQQIRRLENEKANLLKKIAVLEETQANTTQQLTERDQAIQAEKSQLSQVEEALNAQKAATVALQDKYNRLQQDAGQVVQITDERNRLKQQNQLLSDRLDTLQEENARLLRSGMINWFIAGACVFGGGWLAGKLSRKKRSTF